MTTNEEIIKKTEKYVRQTLEGEGSGHDWWHIYRVWQMARHLSVGEGPVDLFVVELGALLHDIADFKFHDDEKKGGKVTRAWLEKSGVEESVISKVVHIVDNVSFKGGVSKSKLETLEGKIVQDADRLDALGAIGIARTFAYGGFKGREIYNPDIKPQKFKSAEEYKNSDSPSLNHFYEKLLLLKDLMNTKSGKKIAIQRHKFMEEFLARFYREWEGQS